MTADTITTILDAWRDDFPGTSLSGGNDDATGWVATPGPGSVSVANSLLTLASGTAAGEVKVRSRKSFLGPFRVIFTAATISQRIANQSVEFRLVSADGAMVASWVFDGVSATAAKGRALNAGSNAGDVAVGTGATTTAANYEVEVTPSEVWFHYRPVDSIGGRTASAVKTSRIPDPDRSLFVEVAIVNAATVTATTVTLDAVLMEDVEELTAEITGGRGGTAPGQSIPVAVRAATTVPTSATGVFNAVEGSAVIAAAGTFTSTVKDLTTVPAMVRKRVLSIADQPITLSLDVSADSVTWTTAASTTAAANVAAQLDVPTVARYWRYRVTNTGAAATTAAATRSYSATLSA